MEKFTKKTIRNAKLANLDKRGRGKGQYHFDHMVSKLEGFKNHIPPFIIGSIHNLQMIKAEDNASKQSKCSIELPNLLDRLPAFQREGIL